MKLRKEKPVIVNGEYRLLENGWERSRVQVSLEAPAVAVWPDHTWPIAVAR